MGTNVSLFIPKEVVFIILLLEATISSKWLHDSTLILLLNSIFNSSAFSIVLFRTIIFRDPSDSNAAITALLAPPAPSTTEAPFFGSQLGNLLFIFLIKP